MSLHKHRRNSGYAKTYYQENKQVSFPEYERVNTLNTFQKQFQPCMEPS